MSSTDNSINTDTNTNININTNSNPDSNTANNKTRKKLAAGVITIIILSLCLCSTSYALVLASVSAPGQYFHTGTIQINLNDGKPVIEEHEFLFEPGMTVKKDFFIENQSTWDVYYRIYFGNVKGDFANVLEITIQDGDKVLFNGTAGELTRANVGAADDVLRVGERRELSVYFHLAEEAGNSAQNRTLSFDMCADAVQTKNNPDKLFD